MNCRTLSVYETDSVYIDNLIPVYYSELFIINQFRKIIKKYLMVLTKRLTSHWDLSHFLLVCSMTSVLLKRFCVFGIYRRVEFNLHIPMCIMSLTMHITTIHTNKIYQTPFNNHVNNAHRFFFPCVYVTWQC